MAVVTTTGASLTAETKAALLNPDFRKKLSEAAHKGANLSTLLHPQLGLKDPLLKLIHNVTGVEIPVKKVFEVERQKDPIEPLLWCILKMLGQFCTQLNSSSPAQDRGVLDELENKLQTLKQLAV